MKIFGWGFGFRIVSWQGSWGCDGSSGSAVSEELSGDGTKVNAGDDSSSRCEPVKHACGPCGHEGGGEEDQDFRGADSTGCESECECCEDSKCGSALTGGDAECEGVPFKHVGEVGVGGDAENFGVGRGSEGIDEYGRS